MRGMGWDYADGDPPDEFMRIYGCTPESRGCLQDVREMIGCLLFLIGMILFIYGIPLLFLLSAMLSSPEATPGLQ